MKTIDKTKGAHLRGLRQKYGITLRELSQASGYSDTMLCYIENGDRVVSDFMESTYLQALPIARERKHQKFIDRKMAA